MLLKRVSPLTLPPTSATRIPHLLRAIASKSSRHSLSTGTGLPHPTQLPPQSKSLPCVSSRPPLRNHASSTLSSPNRPSRHTLPRNLPRPTLSEATGSPPESNRSLTTYLYILCGASVALGIYVSYVYATYQNHLRQCASRGLDSSTLPFNADVSSRYDDLGRDYDEEVDLSERWMSMGRKRGRVVKQARGKVLEVSSGTGRNMGYYGWDGGGIENVTFNDMSAVQLGTLERKWLELKAGWAEEARKGKRKVGDGFTGEVRFVAGDAGLRGVIRRPEGGFDSVVQTMGICSQKDPVGFLRMMGELVRQPDLELQLRYQEKKKHRESRFGEEEEDDGLGGRILLLEHGRGYYEWLNRVLDNGAIMHADHYGCWWNKDIGAIVEESGLKVEKIKRYHWGTTWEVVLRPNSNQVRGPDARTEDSSRQQRAYLKGGDLEKSTKSKKVKWW